MILFYILFILLLVGVGLFIVTATVTLYYSIGGRKNIIKFIETYFSISLPRLGSGHQREALQVTNLLEKRKLVVKFIGQ
jgi:hypothetical protein